MIKIKKQISERRIIVEKINFLTNAIRELEEEANDFTEDDYIDAMVTYNRIEEFKEEIKQLKQEIKKYK